MSLYQQSAGRLILPLWRDSTREAQGQGELNGADQPAENKVTSLPEPSATLSSMIKEFDRNRSVGMAADVINTAILDKTPNLAISAAEFLINNKDDSPQLITLLAQSILDGSDGRQQARLNPTRQFRIARLRRLISIYPRNPIALVDLSREYTQIAKKDSASNAMLTAMALAPSSRWIHRMASRLFVHQKQTQLAHSLLLRHPQVRRDPWMMAAELAVSMKNGNGPSNWKLAKRMLQDQAHHPRDLSELACAVAGLELQAGSRSSARKHLRAASICPSDNALAQLKWAEREFSTDNFVSEALIAQQQSAYEARMWASYYASDIHEAADMAIAWHEDEPFSRRAAEQRAYLSCLLEDYDDVIESVKMGLSADPDNDNLQLNADYAILASGRVTKEDAQAIESHAVLALNLNRPMADASRIHAMANYGMLCYHYIEMAEQGRAAYEWASAYAAKNNLRHSEAAAVVHHARAAVLTNTPWATEVLNTATSIMENLDSPGLRFAIAKVLFVAKNPDKANLIFSRDFKIPSNPSIATQHSEMEKNLAELNFSINFRTNRAIITLPKKI